MSSSQQAPGMIWPSPYNSGHREALASPEQQTAVRAFLDGFARQVRQLLTQRGVQQSSVPFLGRTEGWSLYCWVFNDRTTCVLARSSGTPQLLFHRDGDEQLKNPDVAAHVVNSQVGGLIFAFSTATDLVQRPESDPSLLDQAQLASAYVDENFGKAYMVKSLLNPQPDNLSLTSGLERFLHNHPDPSRNVFVMMRIKGDDILSRIWSTVRQSLEERGFNALRADNDQPHYIPSNLFDNVRVYMHGCAQGIAIFHHPDASDATFNPNVSLEVGYMKAIGKPVLLLKDAVLTVDLHADLRPELFREFTSYQIEESIPAQLDKWINLDLGARQAGSVSSD